MCIAIIMYLLPDCEVNGNAPVWLEWMVLARSATFMIMLSSCLIWDCGAFSVSGSILCAVLLLWCTPVPFVWWIVPPASAPSYAPFVFHWSWESARWLVVLSDLATWHNFLHRLHQGRFLLGETLMQHGSRVRFVGCWVGQSLHWLFKLLPRILCRLVFPGVLSPGQVSRVLWIGTMVRWQWGWLRLWSWKS